jgi:hypothetical protein
MLKFFIWRSFEGLLRFDRVCLKAVRVPMLCVGMGSGGSASRISGRAALALVVSRLSLDTRAILLMNY